MHLQNRKIVLFIDNFSGHNIEYSPTNIRLEFFAPNLTPFVQPLDAGIIRCFKAHYRALFCQRALELDTIGKENIFEINIREAMLMAKEAWDAVQPTTIKHCWNHTGIQRDPIMLRIPARHGHEDGAQDGVCQASSEAWNVLEDLATSQKTLPEAEDGLKKIYGNTYQDSVWRPALAALTGSETTEAALEELAKFKATAENSVVEVGARDRPMQVVKTKLMDAVVELKARRRIFGPLPSFEDLVNPPGELEIGENPDRFESDTDIIEVVRKGVNGEVESEVDEDEVEECPQPQMSRAEMAKLSETLRLVCIGAEVEVVYELSKVLRKFEAQIRTLDLQKSTQQRLGGA